MANKVTLKRSSVQGKSPQISDLDYGEVALNFADGRLYYRNSSDEIDFFDASARGGSDGVQDVSLDQDTDFGLVADSDDYIESGYVEDGYAPSSESSSVEDTLDLGLVADNETSSIDLGIVPTITGFVTPETLILPDHDSNSLPSTTPEYQLIYLSDQDRLAFSDGNNWNQFATVATSGSYNDLSDTPSFTGSYNDLSDTPNLATVATTGDYDDLTNKPPQGASTGKAIAMAIVFG